MENNKNVKVIFDNGGGITLQLGNYGHYYDDAENAVNDYIEFLKNQDTSDWEGNDQEALELNSNWEDVQNGGYTIMDFEDIKNAIKDEDIENYWGHNVEEFINKLKMKKI